MALKTKRLLFIIVYFLIVLLPLLVMLLAPMEKRNFWREFAVAIGFVGFNLAGMQLLPVARIPWVAGTFPPDKIYKTHHVLSVVSVLLVLFHPITLILQNTRLVALLNLFKIGWTPLSGWFGLFGLILIGVTSIFRKRLKIGYTGWLIQHDILTVIILVFSTIHILRVDYYLAVPSMRITWIAILKIWVGLAVYLRIVKPLMVSRRPYEVIRVEPEGKDTFSLYLKPDGHAGVPFEAGQIAWISMGSQPFVVSRNPFSYAGSSLRFNEVRFAIKKAGDFTEKVSAIKPGSKVLIDGPYGPFKLDDQRMRKGLVLLGGGIGMAPVMGILNTLADREDKRQVYVFYGDYSEETELFKDELESLRSRLNMDLIKVFEKPKDENYQHKGYITGPLLLKMLPENYKDFYYFLCGPLPMIYALEKTLAEMGVHRKQIGTEKYEMA